MKKARAWTPRDVEQYFRMEVDRRMAAMGFKGEWRNDPVAMKVYVEVLAPQIAGILKENGWEDLTDG